MIDGNYPQNAELLVEDGIRMYDLPDLVPMKLGAIWERGARKDFYDVACLLEQHSLGQMLDWYQKKYPQYEVFPVLRSLVYFDDAEEQPEPQMLWPVAWGEVKERVAEAVAREVRGAWSQGARGCGGFTGRRGELWRSAWGAIAGWKVGAVVREVRG